MLSIIIISLLLSIVSTVMAIKETKKGFIRYQGREEEEHLKSIDKFLIFGIIASISLIVLIITLSIYL